MMMTTMQGYLDNKSLKSQLLMYECIIERECLPDIIKSLFPGQQHKSKHFNLSLLSPIESSSTNTAIADAASIGYNPLAIPLPSVILFILAVPGTAINWLFNHFTRVEEVISSQLSLKRRI